MTFQRVVRSHTSKVSGGKDMICAHRPTAWGHFDAQPDLQEPSAATLHRRKRPRLSGNSWFPVPGIGRFSVRLSSGDEHALPRPSVVTDDPGEYPRKARSATTGAGNRALVLGMGTRRGRGCSGHVRSEVCSHLRQLDHFGISFGKKEFCVHGHTPKLSVFCLSARS